MTAVEEVQVVAAWEDETEGPMSKLVNFSRGVEVNNSRQEPARTVVSLR